jgi:hypothetical protein
MTDKERIKVIKTELDRVLGVLDSVKHENDMLRAALGVPYGRRETDETDYNENYGYLRQ